MYFSVCMYVFACLYACICAHSCVCYSHTRDMAYMWRRERISSVVRSHFVRQDLQFDFHLPKGAQQLQMCGPVPGFLWSLGI